MARWPEWFRRVGDGATHPRALDVGKKLLGYLAIRRQTPGVQTLTQRVVLDDGTVVEASFSGDQPQVTVYAPDGGEACELYVESGMLDLGQNLAADAGSRFNRGPPVFDARPATLHFGDGVDCHAGEPGLNGKIRVNPATRQISSECLPKQGRSVQSRLRDPEKKLAQAMLPASCWSGLMQRYVQAIYGGDAVKYSGSKTALTVNGVELGCTSERVTGLVELGAELVFITIAGSTATWNAVEFTACGKSVYAAYLTAKRANKTALADKFLTVALSCAMPSKIKGGAVQGSLSGAGKPTIASGWQFSRVGAEAAAVLYDEVRACELWRLTFTRSGSAVTVSEALLERQALPMSDIACTISCPGQSETTLSGNMGWLQPGQRVDHPAAAFYDDGGMVVIRYSVDASQDFVATEGFECRNASLTPVGTPYPTEAAASVYTCAAYTRATEPEPFVSLPRSPVTKVACGIYARRSNGAVLWGTVEAVDALIHAGDAGSGAADQRVGFSTTGFASHTVAAPTSKTSTVSFTSLVSGEPRPFETGNDSIGADPRCAYIKTTALRECDSYECGHICTQVSLGDAPSVGLCHGPVVGGCVTVVDCGTGMHTPYISSGSMTCTYSCLSTTSYQAGGLLLTGKKSVLVQAHGASAGFAVIEVRRRGCTTDDPFNGYSVDGQPQVRCYAPTNGDCTGTVTVSCDGGPYPGHPEAAHAAHTEDVSVSLAALTGAERYLEPLEVGVAFHKTGVHRYEADFDVVGFDGVLRKGVAKGFSLEYVNGLDIIVTSVVGGIPTLDTFAASNRVPFERGDLTCPTFYSLLRTDLDDAPVWVDSESGNVRLEVEVMKAERIHGVFQKGFTYSMRCSLLGAETRISNPLQFGESVNMDREVVTGGYPKVNTPSFVGWA